MEIRRQILLEILEASSVIGDEDLVPLPCELWDQDLNESLPRFSYFGIMFLVIISAESKKVSIRHKKERRILIEENMAREEQSSPKDELPLV